MENKVIVFTGNQNCCIERVEKCLLGLGHFDFSVIVCHTLDDCIAQCGQEFDTGIVICDNHDLDRILEGVKKEDDTLELLHEQAVSLRHGAKKMLFLPLGVKLEMFFKEFLGDFGAIVHSVFGKSVGYVQNIFSSVRCDYKIITKTPILHTVYCSTTVNPEILKSALGENLFSLEDENIASACASVLAASGQSVAIAEQVSGGLACGSLARERDCKFIKSAAVLRTDADFEKYGISAEFLQEKKAASRETAFELAKNLIKTTEADIVMAIVGEDNKFFVAIGNKQEIHVFSTSFDGQHRENIDNLVDFALFRLMRAAM